MMQNVTLGLFLSVAPAVASACMVEGAPAGWQDAPTRVARDGSFIGGGAVYGVSITGGPVVNIGGGRIGQRIEFQGPCDGQETLVFIDCNSLAAIWIGGQPYEGDALTGGTDADALYPPEGALQLSAETTIEALAAVATREGYSWGNLADLLPSYARDEVPTPYSLCRLAYPGSAGATQ
jgi:hypothetical protein